MKLLPLSRVCNAEESHAVPVKRILDAYGDRYDPYSRIMYVRARWSSTLMRIEKEITRTGLDGHHCSHRFLRIMFNP